MACQCPQLTWQLQHSLSNEKSPPNYYVQLIYFCLFLSHSGSSDVPITSVWSKHGTTWKAGSLSRIYISRDLKRACCKPRLRLAGCRYAAPIQWVHADVGRCDDWRANEGHGAYSVSRTPEHNISALKEEIRTDACGSKSDDPPLRMHITGGLLELISSSSVQTHSKCRRNTGKRQLEC
jgi:hypothetical protein